MPTYTPHFLSIKGVETNSYSCLTYNPKTGCVDGVPISRNLEGVWGVDPQLLEAVDTFMAGLRRTIFKSPSWAEVDQLWLPGFEPKIPQNTKPPPKAAVWNITLEDLGL